MFKFVKIIEMKPNFEIELLSEAIEFSENLESKTREKIYYNLRKAQFINDSTLFKKLNSNIWEFRTLFNGNSYRLYAFWHSDKGKERVVIATHGHIKKSQKTLLKEIKKAEDIRKEYLEFKSKENDK